MFFYFSAHLGCRCVSDHGEGLEGKHTPVPATPASVAADSGGFVQLTSIAMVAEVVWDVD